MSVHPNLLYPVHRIRAQFADDVGNVFRSYGTGFWIATWGLADDGEPTHRSIFVTNRHTVDPLYKARLNPGAMLLKTEIEMRYGPNLVSTDGPSRIVPNLPQDWAEIDPADAPVFHETADCAIYRWPILKKERDWYHVLPMDYTMVSDDAWYQRHAHLTDLCTFTGFAGVDARDSEKSIRWWDTDHGLPIARLATIASEPRVDFGNERIRGLYPWNVDRLGLVAGLSFSGCSGSPLFVHTAELPATPEPYHRPLKLIGIMSGQLSEPDGTGNGGVAYFTRASAIRDLVERAVTDAQASSHP